ncbi:GNAT family N-acetyltransferase [Methylocystis sp. H4A]|nr:GNAT family N-acetyltransferase [Methylocystis sp. H4A]MBG0802018.1 GNAT family N-acetyltransferase [Methylocystis sp. H4A]
MIRLSWTDPYRLSAIIGSENGDCWSALRRLECFYPGFENWYHTQVMPGLRLGTREAFLSYRENFLAGVAIVKRDPSETKLCTLWVVPEFRGLGIGRTLAASAFEWLGTNRPLFTVPEERIGEFDKLVSAWHFKRTQVIEGVYRSGKLEHVFNGRLIRPS